MTKNVKAVLLIMALIFWAGCPAAQEQKQQYAAEDAENIAREWIKEKAPTYAERGGHRLNKVETKRLKNDVYQLVYEFKSRFSGYGEVAEDEMSAQVITPHSIEMTIAAGIVVEAVTDGFFDEITGELLESGNNEETGGGASPTASVVLYLIELVDQTERIVPVKREVSLVNGSEKSAIIALTEGVTAEEHEQGYSSSIPAATELLSFSIDNGMATVDFSSEIEPGGGSAWVTAIRDQISHTLMAFDSVSEVTILVEGQRKDILQP